MGPKHQARSFVRSFLGWMSLLSRQEVGNNLQCFSIGLLQNNIHDWQTCLIRKS
jgi:hypothetical protein